MDHVCMCVHVYVYVHICTCIHICAHIYVYTCTFIYIYACVFIWGCFSEFSVTVSDSAVQMSERLVQPHDNRTRLLGRSGGSV